MTEDLPASKKKPGVLSGCLIIFGLILVIGTCNRLVNGPPKPETIAPAPSAKAPAKARQEDAKPPTAAPREATKKVKSERVLPSCAWLKYETLRLFYFKDKSIVKLYDPTETFRSSTEVRCSGRAAWSDATSTPVYFRTYVDEDGDELVEGGETPF